MTAWACRACGSTAFRWRKNGRRANGKPARLRECRRCKPKAPRVTLQGKDRCPRCGSDEIVVRENAGRPTRRCLECERRWAREATKRHGGRYQRAYEERMGLRRQRADAPLDEDPWLDNYRRLHEAMADDRQDGRMDRRGPTQARDTRARARKADRWTDN